MDRFGRRAAAGIRRSMALLVSLAVAVGGVVLAVSAPATAAPAPSCVDSAADSAAARALATWCGRRVEDLSAREETRQVFANPDGTSTLEASILPRRVRRPGGAWAPADPTLVRRGDGGWAPRAATLDVRFSGGGTMPLVSVHRGSRMFTLGWPAALPAPKIAGDSASYRGVLPGVDLVVTATVTGFTHVLVVRDASAAANPALRRIRYPMGGSGVRIDRTAAGGVSVVGDDGAVLLTSGAAVMWDSTAGVSASGGRGALGGDAGAATGRAERSTARGAGDRARRSTAATEVAGGELVLRPDPALLANARFPLYIDPAFHGPTPSRWAYSNSANENNDTSTVRMGRSPTSGAVYRPLFEFPVGVLAGSRILSATFQIQLYHSWSCGPTPASLWRAYGIVSTPKNPWGNSGVNTYLNTQWAAANKDSCYTSAQPTMFFGGNLAGDVQAVASSGWSAYTLALTALNSDGTGEWTTDRWKKFNVGTAVLVVNYNHAPRQPGLADLSIDPSIACTDGTVYVNTESGLTLRATLSDPNNDNLKAQWLVNGIPAQYAPPDSGLAAGGSFTTTIPAAAFTDATTYTWQVRGNDNTDAGAWSPVCTFWVDNSLPGNPTATSTDLALATGLLVPAPPATAVVNRPAAVTIAKPAADANIAGYLIGVGAGAQATPSIWIAAGTDGNAVVPVVPLADGSTLNYLTIQARNFTGQTGATVVYKFKANTGAASPGVLRDVSGDGKADVAGVYDAGNNRISLLNFTRLADGSGVFNPTTPITTDPNTFPAGSPQVAGDFNGDGRSDVAKFHDEGGSCHISLTWWLSTGNGYVQSPAPLWDSGAGNWCMDRIRPVVGDFNADGKADIATFYIYDGATTRIFTFIAKADGSGFSSPFEWWGSGSGNWDGWRTVPAAGDFDGDGRDELAALYDYGSCTARLWMFSSTGTSFVGTGSPWLGQNNWCLADTRNFLAGDMDGDGKDELVAVGCTCAAGTWRVYRWTGPSFNTYSVVGGNSGWSDLAQTKFLGGDFNGDGRFDIGHFYNGGGTRTTLWVLYSTGTAFGAETLQWDSINVTGGLDWTRIAPL